VPIGRTILVPLGAGGLVLRQFRPLPDRLAIPGQDELRLGVTSLEVDQAFEEAALEPVIPAVPGRRVPASPPAAMGGIQRLQQEDVIGDRHAFPLPSGGGSRTLISYI